MEHIVNTWPLIALILIVEFFLSATWNRPYFTIGLPIFVKHVPASPNRFTLPDTKELEALFPSSFVEHSWLFEKLSANEYAFREKLFEFHLFAHRSTPIMHGLLIYDSNQQQVIVRGYVNWWVLVFALVCIGLAFVTPTGSFCLSGTFVLVVGLAYVNQVSRFAKVASTAASLWSEPDRSKTLLATGSEFEENENQDTWECDECGATVDALATKCPHCGAEFES